MRMTISAALALATSIAITAAAQKRERLNPVIALLEHHQPVFGVYWPANGGGRRGGDPPPARPVIDLARDALGYRAADFLFNGSMEGGVDRGMPAYVAFANALGEAAGPSKGTYFGVRHPLIVKTPTIATDSAQAVENIGRELNVGASGIMFVEAESAGEVRQGLAAHVREIAAVKGIGVRWPGAGTLRGVFSTTNAAGERVVDMVAHENAIQQVLAACKEFNVPCGYPANAGDIETRMKQGFSVFVMNWGDAGFQAVDLGRKASGRAATDR